VGELKDTTVEDARLMLDVNVLAPLMTIQSALPLLEKRGTPEHPARVVIIGSIAGLRPKVSSGFYGASKAALHVMAQVFSVELAPSGVTVNVVAPGSTDTPMNKAAIGDGRTVGFRPSGASPLGRIAQPDDIANAVLYLLSEQARFVNGVVLPVDGGTRAAFDNREP
jgi:3-oxoacyl-[acyl-carrier protein] reductase